MNQETDFGKQAVLPLTEEQAIEFRWKYQEPNNLGEEWRKLPISHRKQIINKVPVTYSTARTPRLERYSTKGDGKRLGFNVFVGIPQGFTPIIAQNSEDLEEKAREAILEKAETQCPAHIYFTSHRIINIGDIKVHQAVVYGTYLAIRNLHTDSIGDYLKDYI